MKKQAVRLRDAHRISDQVFAKIWRFYHEPRSNIVLTDEQDAMRKRLVKMWDLLCGELLSDYKAICAYVQYYADQGITLSEKRGRADLLQCKLLFGDPRNNHHLFERKRMSEILLDQIAKMRQIQETKPDRSVFAAKVITLLIARYSKINGLEVDDIRKAVPRPPIKIVFTGDEKTLKKQAAQLMKDISIETPFEETE
jgi:hypothetical protein